MPETHVKFHSTNGKRLILIIDDEEINRLLLSGMLEENYELLTASDGTEALRILHDRRGMLSLVLLDLILPDLHGFDILREMRAEPDLARIPVIVMTSDRASEVESLSLGASDFIPKPYPEPKIVHARVRRTIELSEDRNIIQQTERDSLTGLYNKEFFFSYAEQFDQHHQNMSMDAAVLDINHFRMVNERYGKSYGDEVLRRIGEKLKEIFHDSSGIVCRREADNFLIYCPHRNDYVEILEYASEGLTGEENANGRVHLRIGIYSDVDKTLDVTRRFDRAKIAADTVRGSYTKAVAFYDKALHEAEIYADQLIEDFPAAISEHQFQVYYQPKFNIQGAQPVLSSAEALVRWLHPRYGMISPGIFIPLFEKNGLIQELDEYVWGEATARMADWKNRLGNHVPVSVNVSRIDMYDPELTDKLKNLVMKNGLKTEDVYLEITESAYTQDSEQIIETVNRLRNLGFRIEMDDFGTGYSSLNMISTLPIDVLKLDMMFIRTAFIRKRDTRIIEVIIDIADHLSVPVIAEGVETEEQVVALKQMGCSVVQGYYFSKPIPPEEFERFLKEKQETDTPSQQNETETAVQPQPEITIDTEDASHSVISEIDVPETEVKTEKGIPLRRVSIFFAIAAVLLATALFISNTLLTRGMVRIEQANERYIRAQEAAGNLEAASDYLTEKVRSFAVTGEIDNLLDFFEEVEVTRRRDMAVSTLEELLQGSDNTAYEYLATALEVSNRLVEREYLSMKYVVDAGNYPEESVPEVIRDLQLSPGEQLLTDEQKKARAIDLVYDEDYMDAKGQIRSNTALCTENLIASAGSELSASNSAMITLMNIQMLLTILFLAVVFLSTFFIALQIRRPLIRMVESMKAKEYVKPDGAEELRFVARTYNEIYEENQQTNERLTFEAMHDGLTGLLNKNAYQVLEPDVDTQHSALLIVDVDKFKSFNDTYGHQMGDRVLKRVAEILQQSFRSTDMIFRIGGDEFVVIMSRANSSMRELVLSKIEQMNTMLQNPKDDLPAISLSVGVAFGDRKNPQGDMLKDADTALYRVKAAGRSGCIIY